MINLPAWFYPAAWVAWGLMFAAIEAIALIDRDRGDTLSEWVWRVLGFHQVIWWMGAGALVWLVLHFLLKWK